MNLVRSARLRVILIVVVALTVIGVLLWWRVRKQGFGNDYIDFNELRAKGQLTEPSPTFSPTPSPTPTPVASISPLPSQSPTPADPVEVPSPQITQSPEQALGPSYVGKLNLIIPVAGVRPERLLDTFADARSEGRIHDAIDIPAPAGTPVLAAADGEIIKLFQSERGGTTIYELSLDKKLVFYYAHLQGYADGLVPGRVVRPGEVIGYVGDSGNAGAGNYHLHFSISVVADPKRYWEGTNINPYPLLKR